MIVRTSSRVITILLSSGAGSAHSKPRHLYRLAAGSPRDAANRSLVAVAAQARQQPHQRTGATVVLRETMRSSSSHKLLQRLLACAADSFAAACPAFPSGLTGACPSSAASALSSRSRGFCAQTRCASSLWPAQRALYHNSSTVSSLSTNGVSVAPAATIRSAAARTRGLHVSPVVQQEFVSLNNLQDNEGARRWVRFRPLTQQDQLSVTRCRVCCSA